VPAANSRHTSVGPGLKLLPQLHQHNETSATDESASVACGSYRSLEHGVLDAAADSVERQSRPNGVAGFHNVACVPSQCVSLVTVRSESFSAYHMQHGPSASQIR